MKKSTKYKRNDSNVVAKSSQALDKFDSWDTFISAMGSRFEGKANNFSFSRKSRLSLAEIETYFSDDRLANKTIKKPIEDMIRQGIELKHEKKDDITKLIEKYDIYQLLDDALLLDGFYGGSAVVMVIDDGQYNANGEIDHSMPLKLDNIKSIDDLFVVDRFFLNPTSSNLLTEPETYTISEFDNKKIHKSRLILFKGIFSGIRNRQRNNGFGESMIFQIKKELSNYHISNNLLPEILIQFVTNVIKFDGMTQAIQQDGEDKILKKATYLQAGRTLLGSLVIDKNDDFVQRTINTSGIEQLMKYIEKRLCTVVEIPHTRFFEESTGAGLSNNGDNSEQSKQYYDSIKSKQVKKLTKPFKQILEIFAALLNINEMIAWDFCELKQESIEQKIKNKKIVADTDRIYNEMGLDGKLIVEKRFTNDYYSHEMTLTPQEINANFNNKSSQQPNNVSSNSAVNNIPDLAKNQTNNSKEVNNNASS
ncbi:MAG: hypothetical protein RL613_358 [Fusobacteriota bacterium]